MRVLESDNMAFEVSPLMESSFERMLVENFSFANIAILVDENTHNYCLDYLLTSFNSLSKAEVILLPAGEENKIIEVCIQVWEALAEYQFEKKDLLINLGGGLVSDLGGFIASTYKRGISYINIPTSLLAMVDAGIGGKTGIDLGNYKNLIGTIFFPVYTYVDNHFLRTLPDKELKNGYAEMLKHALISEVELWHILVKIDSLNQLINTEAIKQSIVIKQTIVSKDPLENGPRKLLNFGHTIGHGIEGYLLNKNPVSHGHAVALGMIGESYLSYKLNFLSNTEFNQIKDQLLKIYELPKMPTSAINEIMKIIKQDKKNKLNKINFTLLEAIGKASIDNFLEEEMVEESLNYLFNLK